MSREYTFKIQVISYANHLQLYRNNVMNSINSYAFDQVDKIFYQAKFTQFR